MTATFPKTETDPVAGAAVTAEAARAAAAEALKQDASTAATDAEVAAVAAGLIPLTQKGAASGVASLGADSLLTPAQRPQTYGLLANRPSVGTAGDKGTYFATDDNGGTLYQVQSAAWVKIAASVTQASGVELGYGACTTSPTSTSTYPTFTDLSASGLTATTPPLSGSQPVKVICRASLVQNSGTGQYIVAIMEGAAVLTYEDASFAPNTGTGVHPEVRLIPSAGVHTYKVGLARLSAAGTVTLFSGTDSPSFIQVVGC